MTDPYYDHAGITIYHGDCREILPEIGPVDLVLTDPPYGIGLESHRGANWSIEGDEDQSAGISAIELVNDLPRWFFCSPYAIWPGDWKDILVWDKGPALGGGGDPKKYFKRTFELILGSGQPAIYGKRDSAVLKYWMTPQQMIHHPNEKPLPLMSYLVKKLSIEASLIIDPFMGSGTTLVAAKQLNRRAIGIEIEEKYCEVAARRLSQEVFQF